MNESESYQIGYFVGKFIFPILLLLFTLIAYKKFYADRPFRKWLTIILFIPLVVFGPTLLKEIKERDASSSQADSNLSSGRELIELQNPAGNKIRARILAVSGNRVEIEREDGARLTTDIAVYSQNSQKLIEEYR